MDQKQKNEELYKAALPAFFNNELESDKTLLGLSIAAIGFYMALFINKDIYFTAMMFICTTTSLLSFFITSAMILLVFMRNKKQLMKIIVTTGKADEDSLLDFLDKWKYFPFVIGVIASVVFTISLMYANLKVKEEQMDKPINTKIVQPGRATNDGISGLMKANQSEQRGISGVSAANQSGSQQTTSTTSSNNNQSAKKE